MTNTDATTDGLPVLTLQQAIILTGYTGICLCPPSEFHKDIERRTGHPVLTHEMARPEFWDRCRDLYAEDLHAITRSLFEAGGDRHAR